MLDQILNFDTTLIRALNGFSGKYDFVDYVAWNVTGLNLIKGGVLAGLLWGVWSIDRPNRDTTTDKIRAIFGVVFIVFIGRLLQLLLPFRARPLHEVSLNFLPVSDVSTGVLENSSSFPSDHAVLCGAITMAIFYRSRVLGTVALLWSLVVIMLPRVYVGLHYPVDVIAGGALGAILMAAVMSMPVPAHAKLTIERWRDRRAPVFETLVFLFLFETATLFQAARFVVTSLGHYVGLRL